jgi:DNA integrity scanning protein DisA with diadenylate cyclase activity
MSNDEICLLYWNGDFYGLGQLAGEYNVEDENLFVIKIHGHYVWSLLHGDHTMMVVSHEQPRLYADEQTDYITEFHKALDLEFTDNSLINKEQLTELFKIALKQLHGTMLVIVDEAQEESKRLRTQSTPIIPSLVSETLMRTITAIDGAVILDPKGICYSIGVILDGVVEEGKGDPARGARLNAAFNYLSYCKRKGFRCLLTVISEDGMVNIFFTQQDKSSQN